MADEVGWEGAWEAPPKLNMEDPPFACEPPNMLEDGGGAAFAGCEAPPKVKLDEEGPLVAGCESPPNVKLDEDGAAGVVLFPNWNGALAC